MKTLLAIAFVLAMTNEGKISEERAVNAPVSIKLLDDNKALLRYKTIPEGSVLVRIFDENNKMVKKQFLKKELAFAKYYDFSNLGPGNYTVEVNEKNRISERIPIVIGNKEEKNEQFTSNLEKLRWNSYKLSLDQENPVEFTVKTFQNGILIHEEKIDPVTSFARKYKLMGVAPSHNVEFVVMRSDGKTQWLSSK
ncbi:hypothetical protein [Cecembia sp.]|uniref:hypothetical protein n=1 Tax=Cecembia sp. TaxID=1898110 RepID=UPI0025BC2C7E|nr:hypothetical protein [Cecembia sp.]